MVGFLNETYLEFELTAILVVGDAPPLVLSDQTGVADSSCLQKPISIERRLDRVGLTTSQLDLRRIGGSPSDRCRPGRPDEEAARLV